MINMNYFSFARYFLIMTLLMSSWSLSHATTKSIPSDLELVAQDKMTSDSVNLTAKNFFKSYLSHSAEERRHAELYFLGVMDATEGKSWCDYRRFKTITLRERIFVDFKKLSVHQLNERASKVIENILSQRYSCKVKK